MAGGPTTAPPPTSNPSRDAPFFRLERDVLTFIHYFGPQGLETIRREFGLSFNRVEFTVQSLQQSGHVRDADFAGRFVSTGLWNPEEDVVKAG